MIIIYILCPLSVIPFHWMIVHCLMLLLIRFMTVWISGLIQHFLD